MWKFALILLLPSMTLAQTPPSGGPYVLKKQVVATGGASAAGLSVIGSVGQRAARAACCACAGQISASCKPAPAPSARCRMRA